MGGTHRSTSGMRQVDQQINERSDAQLTRQVNLPGLDISRKHITGQRLFFFFGLNEDIGTSWEDIVPYGGNINWLTGAGKVEVISSHTDDTILGAGVRSVEIHGLSGAGVDQDEVIEMDGTDAVESELTYCRINKMHNETVGTYGGSHRGDVTCRVTGNGAVLAVMTGHEGNAGDSVQYGSGEAGAGHYTIPLGKVAYLIGGEVFINTTGTKTADIILYEREGILTTSAPQLPRRLLWDAIEVQGVIPFRFDSFIKIKALTDIWFRSEASNINTKISVFLEFFLGDEDASGA